MTRSAQIHEALLTVLGDSRLVVLHSALWRFGMHPSGLREDMLAALMRLVDGGRTLALPAFTFSFTKTGWFHYQQAASETGVLADWLLGVEPSARTPHPVYSFAVAGPLREVCAGRRTLGAFGPGTMFELFEREDARIVMLGSPWRLCTQVHRYEELAEVRYRHRKDFAGIADFGEGQRPVAARLFVRDVALGSTLTYRPVFERLRAEGCIAGTSVGRGPVEAIDTREVARVCLDMLAKDPFALLANAREVSQRLEEQARAST